MVSLNILKTEWDLSPLAAGDADSAFEQKRVEIQAANEAFVKKWRGRDDYVNDPKVLKEALDEYEALFSRYGMCGDEGYYFHLRGAQDEDNPSLKAREQHIHDFSVKLANDIQFFELRIAKIPEAEQSRFLAAPELSAYRYYLERLFKTAKYNLSEPEEAILNLVGKPAVGNWVDMVSRFLNREERETRTEDGTRAKKNFNELLSLLSSRDKSVRDEAAEHVRTILGTHVDVAEAEINSMLEFKRAIGERRGYCRPDEARHVSDDIDTEAVDALIRTVSDNFDTAKRYYALKAKLLGVPRLAYHERNVPYGSVNKKYSYFDAAHLVHKVFEHLDRSFADIFRRFVESGQVDVYPRKGKSGGAFCAHELLTQPTYILMNYTDELNDVLTLAHESGHGINNELIREKQNALSFDTPLATAEVASTFMEDFVLEHLMEDASDELKLSLMMMKLNDDISTIYRQSALYRFEQEIHAEYREKGYLSKDDIGAMFRKHMEAYMGEAVAQSPGSEHWWVHWSHIRAPFYVYSYASGLLISKAMQARVREDPAFIAQVKQFLSAGLSDSPRNIFANMGIDISDPSFWDSGLQEVKALLASTELLAVKLGKL
ncbi:MAG: hypothetical protein COW88_01690 [Candidatus Lloydbacteria bacterium CG22_combo_CG10-13_8_21_14_all_47_15]|uniref:Oligoendopeptidase F n=1 Tax=Candidatus Lloydbacteria bacterium CG22_combo_CG10-13_8_21_14_all_47_15 TaxID=1974635 RepID=A0A2H0CU88_9BACT|nr:MAG: hypothetical protein COW88_01690 [Candidatus Lloydbacteria bacterium CG22_combo_CG10-13_8_21_14_all_47_15]